MGKPQPMDARHSMEGSGSPQANSPAKCAKPAPADAKRFSLDDELPVDSDVQVADWTVLPLRGHVRLAPSASCSVSQWSRPLANMTPHVPRWPDDVKKGVAQQLETMFSNYGKWSFNAIEFSKQMENQTLQFIAWEALTRGNCITEFSMNPEKLRSFLQEVEAMYLRKAPTPFHNNIHAADVTQALHAMLTECAVDMFYDPMDVFGSLIAAVVHDLGHTGKSNTFHVAMQDDIALIYNDISVLENLSVAQALKLLKEKRNTDFLADFAPVQARMLRKEIISMVLNTDIACHYQLRSSFDSSFCRYTHDPGAWHSDEYAMDSLRGTVLHLADHSYLAREQSIDWFERLQLELFAQGDEELAVGLPVSPFCERSAPRTPATQIGLLDFVVQPLVLSIARLAPKVAGIPLRSLESNKELLKGMEEKHNI